MPLKNYEKRLDYIKNWKIQNPDKVKETGRKYRENHPDKTGTAYYRNTRFKCIEFYSNRLFVCSCCNENHYEFLTIDHINGGGVQHRKELKAQKTSQDIYRYLIKNNFPDGYRVLCYNCNCCLGHYGYCPHSQ